MIIPNQCIIIGGGSSIKEGLTLGLKEQIKDMFVILCNFAMYHFEGTVLTFVDSLSRNDGAFYNKCFEDVKKFPLCIGRYDDRIPKEDKFNNTIFLKGSADYKREYSFKEGVYTPTLSGIWAITIAIQLLKSKGEIFLCGFDWTRRTKEQKKNKEIADTHYYTDKPHRGIGLTSMFEENNSKTLFQPFLRETNIKIYNVNPNSNIEEFEKINYLTFFQKLDKLKYNQEELRQWIRETIKNRQF